MRRQEAPALSLALFLLTTSCPSPNAPRTAPTTAAMPAAEVVEAAPAPAPNAPPRGPPPAAMPAAEVVEAVRAAAHPLTGQPGDYAPLLELVGDNRFVLLGEATHGTHEFYEERARITRQLIQEKGFSAIAIEGNWADADRVNRYIRGLGQDPGATQALANFKNEFPDWMWSNAALRDLVTRLRAHHARPPAARTR